MRSKRSWARAAALLMALGAVAVACGDDGGSSSNASGTSGATATSTGKTGASAATTTLAPQKGGSITVGMFSETRGLDPTIGSGSGTAGGTEMIALYDTVVAWNPDTRKYDMRTAESLNSNADSSEWTLKLKSGIKFRDGTPYDADAVKYNWERYISTVNTSTSRSWLVYVMGDAKGITVVDPLTVKFTLKVPFAGFPALLSHTPGMILSPTKLKALGDPTAADYKAKSDAFNLKPEGAGAGPFEIVQWTKGESIVMKKSPTYYGGDVYLDEVKFVNLNSSDKNVDALKTGTMNVGFLRSPQSVANATADKTLGGVNSYIQAGGMLLMNQGVKVTCKDGKPDPLCVGKPDGAISSAPNTADAKVRAAVAAAIDPAVINTRVSDGKGIPNNALFDKNFTLNPGVDGVKPDAAAAKKSLDEAKAAGASSKIRLACTNQPERVALAQTVDTQLKAAGFDTNIKADIDTATQITEITTKRDFDLGCWGLSMPNDDTAILALVQNFWSLSPTNRVGYSSAAWDAALNVALAAKDDAAKKAAYKTLAELWNKDVPSVIFETVIERVAYQNKVHGVAVTENTMFYLDKAWLEK
jgi:peptide/nickel transport system substrate-binding protein